MGITTISGNGHSNKVAAEIETGPGSVSRFSRYEQEYSRHILQAQQMVDYLGTLPYDKQNEVIRFIIEKVKQKRALGIDRIKGALDDELKLYGDLERMK